MAGDFLASLGIDEQGRPLPPAAYISRINQEIDKVQNQIAQTPPYDRSGYLASYNVTRNQLVAKRREIEQMMAGAEQAAQAAPAPSNAAPSLSDLLRSRPQMGAMQMPPDMSAMQINPALLRRMQQQQAPMVVPEEVEVPPEPTIHERIMKYFNPRYFDPEEFYREGGA